MHYWIGTTIQVQESHRRPGPVSINDQSRIKNKSAFEPGVVYQLYNIRPNRDKTVVYEFSRSDGGQDLHMQFNSTGEAEAYIAAALNETVPDYTEIHRNFP